MRVDADSAGRRIDNFLVSELKGVPKTRIYRMIRKGEVRVNKGRIKAAHKLSEGDEVRIPPVSQAPAAGRAGAGGGQWIAGCILYEDEHLLALNKPAGVAVHGGSGISQGVIEALRVARPDCRYLELVHRLDRATSGVLLVAKKRSALRRLHAAFREGTTDKVYAALLVGDWQGGEREVSLPLVVEHRQNGERHVRPGAEGKEALTRFIPAELFGGFALLRVELLTGRTHQIRAHAAAIDHPVAGDERYGNGVKPPGLKRLFLHAEQLTVPHPASEEPIRFEAPLDPALTRVLAGLRGLAGPGRRP